MKNFLIFLISFFLIYFIISCNANKKRDCKQLIAKTWEFQSMEFNRQKLLENSEKIFFKKLKESELDEGVAFLKKMWEEKKAKDGSLMAFDEKGKILDNNLNEVAEYKLTLDCEKIIIKYPGISINGNRGKDNFDTGIIKVLTNEKLILESNVGITTIYKSKK